MRNHKAKTKMGQAVETVKEASNNFHDLKKLRQSKLVIMTFKKVEKVRVGNFVSEKS